MTHYKMAVRSAENDKEINLVNDKENEVSIELQDS